jgi:endonuclease/exonuclease/phosphatase (EEP) superfamily protein YafD
MQTPARKQRSWSTPSLFLSFLLLAFLAAAYETRPDALAALIYAPSWLGALVGLDLLYHGRRATNRWIPVALLLLWVGFLFRYEDETVPLVRGFLLPPPQAVAATEPGTRLRVITLNCALGNPDAAREALPYHPDIVLLQESPGREDLLTLAKRLFGKGAVVVRGYDTALLTRGTLTERPLTPEELLFYVAARARLADGSEVELVSLHLSTPTVRADLWNPACWREQAEQHRLQRGQLETVARRLQAVPPNALVLVGGDFNLPAGDSIFRQLQPRLRDAFREVGRGWGDTITNDLPIHRMTRSGSATGSMSCVPSPARPSIPTIAWSSVTFSFSHPP